jgi:uncharacterized protein YvpB
VVHARRGIAAIVAIVIGGAAIAMVPVTAEAAMIRLPVGTQRMQMPLDCEAASLTIALASVGIRTTQQYVQAHFPTDTRAPILGADGLPAKWGDPYTDFVGHVMGSEPGSNPHWTTYPGWGAYAPVVAREAEALGAPVAAQLTGWNPQALYAAVEAGHPVLVWSTVNYSSQTARTWTAWDGRVIPWTQAGHVVVLMGVNPTAGTLEFSDPLTGGYNGTTMAQFARTFNIYGDMAIVIEPTARAAVAPARMHRAASTPKPTTPPAPQPTVTAAPWMPIHHVREVTSFGNPGSAAYAAATLATLTTLVASGSGGEPLLVGASLLAALTCVALGVRFRRRRRPCAG